VKKLREFVSKGTPEETPWEEPFVYEPPQRSRSSQLHPADLPRDPGMAGAVGAYEINALSGALPKSLEALETLINASIDAEACITAELDKLIPAAERYRIALESVENGVITLSLAHRGDRYLYTRTLVPKLKKALQPLLGLVRIQLTDRL
jgi:hypothetical protein